MFWSDPIPILYLRLFFILKFFYAKNQKYLLWQKNDHNKNMLYENIL